MAGGGLAIPANGTVQADMGLDCMGIPFGASNNPPSNLIFLVNISLSHLIIIYSLSSTKNLHACCAQIKNKPHSFLVNFFVLVST
jgi:hypothetical protein